LPSAVCCFGHHAVQASSGSDTTDDYNGRFVLRNERNRLGGFECAYTTSGPSDRRLDSFDVSAEEAGPPRPAATAALTRSFR